VDFCTKIKFGLLLALPSVLGFGGGSGAIFLFRMPPKALLGADLQKVDLAKSCFQRT
jgi:hypothetical protein